MKRLLLLTILLLPACLMSQEITKTYDFSNPEIIYQNDYCMVKFENTMQIAKLGNPLLPYLAAEILLPPGYEASNITLEFGELVDVELNSQLCPKQAVRTYSSSTPFSFNKNEEVYKSNKYPEKAHSTLATHFYRGYSIANVSFTPIVYNPLENKLSYYSSVTIKFATETTQKATDALKFLRETKEIEKRVHNPEMIGKYASLISVEAKDEAYDVLILSTTTFESALEKLILLHTKQGLVSKFKDLAEVYTEMEGIDNAEKVRNYIIQEYQNNSIEHVVLGGDVEVCPYRGFYCKVQSSSIQEDSNIPSDLYFSALDGSWNDNGNSLWGEIGEEDLYPDISVARMPFSNLNELDAMLHKAEKYQFSPVLGELNSPLLVGENLYYAPLSWGADYLELLVGERNDNGYFTAGIPAASPYDSLYDRTAYWNKNQLRARMNEGASFIYHSGHSDWNYAMRFSNGDITSNNFSGLNGETHNYTLIYSHGCICGAFDESDCIGEKMVTNQNLAVAVVFNSRFGWFNEGQTEGPSAHINREFVDALYTDKYNRLGRAHMESKIATAPWVNAEDQFEEGAIRWCFYDCNALGDPTLAIWRDEPYEVVFTGESLFSFSATACLPFYEGNITINSEKIAGVSCVLMSGDELIGKTVTDENGDFKISFVTELPNVEFVELYISDYNTMYVGVLNNTDDIIGIDDFGDNVISIFPNPTTNSINFNLPEVVKDHQKIEILNVSGQVIKTHKVALQNTIDISMLPAGNYFVRYGKNIAKFIKK